MEMIKKCFISISYFQSSHPFKSLNEVRILIKGTENEMSVMSSGVMQKVYSSFCLSGTFCGRRASVREPINLQTVIISSVTHEPSQTLLKWLSPSSLHSLSFAPHSYFIHHYFFTGPLSIISSILKYICHRPPGKMKWIAFRW